jgi:2-keto-myo-inositol isomerase
VRVAHTGAATPVVSLDDDIRIAERVAADGLELWVPKLWPSLERVGIEGLKSALRRQRVAPLTLAPVADVLFRDLAGIEETIAAVHRLAEVGRALGAGWLVLTPGARPDGADERDVALEARARLPRLLDIAGRYDVGLALTPGGRPDASVRTLAAAAAIVDAMDRPGLALAVDTFALYASHSAPEEVKACRPGWLALLRLADAPGDIEPESLRDRHRLPPGDGVVPIAQWIGLIRQLGADPVAVVPVAPADSADAEGWVRQLRERALAIAQEPRRAAR